MTTRGVASAARTIAVRRVDGLLTRERTLVYPALVTGCFAVVLLVSWVLPHGPLPLPDFLARWTAGRLLIDGAGSTLYDPHVQSKVQVGLGSTQLSWFVSPPFVAGAFAPLGMLPYDVACGLWVAFTVLGLAGAFFILLRAVRPPEGMAWTRLLLPLIGSYPILELVGSGQDTAIVLVLVVLGWWLLRGGHDALAGCVLALGLMKPHLMLVVPILLLLHRRWRALWAFIATAGALFGVSVLLVRMDGVLAWVAIASDPTFTTEVQMGQAWKQVSLSGLIVGMLPPGIGGGGHLVAYAAGLAFGLRALPGLSSRDITALSTWALTLGVTLVASPHVMVYDVVLAAPLLLLLPRMWWTPSSRAVLAVTYCALWLVPLCHAVLGRRTWPVSALGAPWVAVLIVVIVWRSLHTISPVEPTRVR